MPVAKQKIAGLLESSRMVIQDCVLDNGAIVAANTDKTYYPREANDYRYVWPRDAAFMLYAARLLGLDIEHGFCEWLLSQAESFETKGLYFRRYATNGASSGPYEEFQPDQAGALLWALTANPSLPLLPHAVTVRVANTLCDSWNGKHFSVPTHDLWEHYRNDTNDDFVYTLACCSYGLRAASDALPDEAARDRWLQVASEMQTLLAGYSGTYFTRTLAHDERIDASLAGLIWPFRVTEDEQMLYATLEVIRDKLTTYNGIMRFENDTYDGRVANAIDLNEGAGPWPLLTCWYVIALYELGQAEEAKVLFEELVQLLPDQFIPEQILPDGRAGVSPLGWSHALFVIAAHRLGYA